MAYDEQLAARIRELVSERHEFAEQKMFGGLAFLIAGHMAVAASGEGGLLVRIDPAQAERLVATTDAEPMVMGDRPMRGWLRVGPSAIGTKRDLRRWVGVGIDQAASLPLKARRPKR